MAGQEFSGSAVELNIGSGECFPKWALDLDIHGPGVHLHGLSPEILDAGGGRAEGGAVDQ